MARNSDNPHKRGRFECLVGRVLGEADLSAAESLPTGLIREVCKLWPDLPERCWLILSRPGMAPATKVQQLLRAEAMYRHGRLSNRDKECRDRLNAVLCSDLDDEGKTETIRQFIAQTLDINEAARRGHELSRILSAGPAVVEIID